MRRRKGERKGIWSHLGLNLCVVTQISRWGGRLPAGKKKDGPGLSGPDGSVQNKIRVQTQLLETRVKHLLPYRLPSYLLMIYLTLSESVAFKGFTLKSGKRIPLQGKAPGN